MRSIVSRLILRALAFTSFRTMQWKLGNPQQPLRNVRLQGVDSVMTPPARRAQAWQRLVTDLPESFYTQAAKEISLAEAPKFAEAIINNQIQGRTLVKVN